MAIATLVESTLLAPLHIFQQKHQNGDVLLDRSNFNGLDIAPIIVSNGCLTGGFD